MIPLRFKLFLLLLSLTFALWSKSLPLIELVNRSGGEIRWDPYREKGLIFKDDTSISFMLKSSIVIVDNSRIVTGISISKKDGELFVSSESADLLYRILKISQSHESIINDSDLFNIPVIILDPGHGGRDSGALGIFNDFDLKEKDVVLALSKMVAEKLRKKYSLKKILLTRNDDRFLTLEERVEMANEVELGKKQAIIYISIHANASLNKKAQGFEVWYLPKGYRRNVLNNNIDGSKKLTSIVNALKEDEISLEGQELAKFILDGMNMEIGELSPNRGLKEEIWFVVRKARMASVLLEVGFVTNEIEGGRLNDSLYLQKVAEGIYNGITGFVSSYEGIGR